MKPWERGPCDVCGCEMEYCRTDPSRGSTVCQDCKHAAKLDERDDQIEALRADVARLTAALAVAWRWIEDASYAMGRVAPDAPRFETMDEDLDVLRADPDGTAALAMVRGLERGLSAATENVTIAIARAEKAERDLTTLRREVRRTGTLTGKLAELLPERRQRDDGRVDGDRREVRDA